MTQMTLFGDAETLKKVRKVHVNSSGNPIVFRDYASFVAKFTEQPKTTDDCYTPEDVYNAVVEYVGTITDMTGKCILRPFYPGGDYENAEYPDNGIVIDNPPFSMFTKIVRWYLANDVPFFLFGNGMTIMQVCKYGATAVIADLNLTFHNGACVRVNFATNLIPEMMAVTAPRLHNAIEACPSQNQKIGLPKYRYPDNVISVSQLQTITNGGIEIGIPRAASITIGGLDNHPKGKSALFGDHILAAQAAAKATAQAAAKAAAQAAEKAAAQAAERIPIPLSEREIKIISTLEDVPTPYKSIL